MGIIGASIGLYWVSSSFSVGNYCRPFLGALVGELIPASQPNRLLNRRSVRSWVLFSAA